MAGFDLARIQGGRARMDFPADGGGEISIYYHHATHEEIAVAYDRAGLRVNSDGVTTRKDGERDTFILAPLLAVALTEIADLCIDEVMGLDGWPVSPHRPSEYGLAALTEEARSLIPRVVLKTIGQTILEASTTSAEEGKPFAPSRSGESS